MLLLKTIETSLEEDETVIDIYCPLNRSAYYFTSPTFECWLQHITPSKWLINLEQSHIELTEAHLAYFKNHFKLL